MSDIYRRCGCRREDGKPFAPLPDRATAEQRAAVCPVMLEEPRHGSWGFTVYGGSDPGTGRRVRERRMGFATKREAQQARAELVGKIASKTYQPRSKVTVAEYLDRWIRRRTDLGVKPLRPSTARMYRTYVEQDIVPAIGRLPVDRVTTDDLQRFVDDLLEAGRGATTVRRIAAVLSSAMSDARRQRLTMLSPAVDLELPETGQEKTRVWEPADAGRFRDAVEHHRLAPLFDLALMTGLRRGELCGLQWGDVDLTRREIVVRRQRVQLGGQVVEGPVKTRAGESRRVDLGSEAVATLLAWRLQQDGERAAWGAAYETGGYVFTWENGAPYRPAHVSRVFDALVTEAALPHLSFHGLRHQHASLMLEAGADIAVVSKRLGHSTISITSDLYSHLTRSAGQAAAEAAEGVLPPRKRGVSSGVSSVDDGIGRTLATQNPLPANREGVSDPEKPGIMRRGG